MMLLLLLAAVSCEYNLATILPEDDTGYIYMRALAMSGDTTVIWLDPTIPVGKTGTPDLEGVEAPGILWMEPGLLPRALSRDADWRLRQAIRISL